MNVAIRFTVFIHTSNVTLAANSHTWLLDTSDLLPLLVDVGFHPDKESTVGYTKLEEKSHTRKDLRFSYCLYTTFTIRFRLSKPKFSKGKTPKCFLYVNGMIFILCVQKTAQ